jgi:hypothetical protein
MSASIYTLLAEELEISDAKAKKLLSAMLHEVKKRAHRDGVHLPNFGRFKEEDGTLVFEPDESLAVAVNHRFEGLSTEDLSTAPMDEDDEASDSDGPSTITLGYQDGSNWSPLDAETETDEESESSDADDEAPDTAEFQVPDVADAEEPPADDADETSPDTADASAAKPDSTSESPAAGESPSRTSAPEDTSPEESMADSASAEEAPPDPTGTDADSSESEQSSSIRDTGARETEKLYPFVEDVPGSPAQSSTDDSEAPSESESSSESDISPAEDSPSMAPPDDDREHDSLSGIWDEDDEETFPDSSPASPSSETENADVTDDTSRSPSPSTEFEMPEPDPPEPEAETTEPDSGEDSDDDTQFEAIEEDVEETSEEESSPSSPPAEKDPSGSSLPRVLVSILVFLLLGGGAWYILGQRGMVQPPQQTFAHLKATLLSGITTGATENSTSVVPEFSPSDDGSSDTTTASTAPPSPDSTPTAAASPSASETDAPVSNEGDADNVPSETPPRDTTATAPATESTSSTAASSSTSSPTIVPEDGGWSIVVASRTDPEAARSLAATYRDRFSDQKIPTGIIESAVNNSTRYRVGVGQFPSRSDVQQFLDEHGDELPDGAWPVQL